MKLVRARVKAPEHLPEWAKCCEEIIRHGQEMGEMVLDLDWANITQPGCRCKFCDVGVLKDGEPTARIVSGQHVGKPMPLVLCDLDEGTLELAT